MRRPLRAKLGLALPSLYLLSLNPWQVYLWRDADGVTLIDAGVAGSGPAIAAELATLGIARADVDRLVLTHFHADHAGGAADVAGWGKVEVLAHAEDAPIIRGDQPAPEPNLGSAVERAMYATLTETKIPDAPPCRVDRELGDGDLLDIAGGAEVTGAPGHTWCSIGLFLLKPRVLFTGDTIAGHGGEIMLGPFNLDPDRAITPFRTLASREADIACFGHGAPLVGDAYLALSSAALNPIRL